MVSLSLYMRDENKLLMSICMAGEYTVSCFQHFTFQSCPHSPITAYTSLNNCTIELLYLYIQYLIMYCSFAFKISLVTFSAFKGLGRERNMIAVTYV